MSKEDLHIADTGLFVAVGSRSNKKYKALRKHAKNNGVVFTIPEKVYRELTGNTLTDNGKNTPVDKAIEEDWVKIHRDIKYRNPLISRTVDQIRNNIASISDRNEGEVEKTDAVLAAVAVNESLERELDVVRIYTTDIPAGESCIKVLNSLDVGFSSEFIYGFEFIENITDSW
ncbi:MAG: hypothetical protein ABEK59_05280 [Halobacteria archaeon]